MLAKSLGGKTLLASGLNFCQAHTSISFDELSEENWVVAGRLLDED